MERVEEIEAAITNLPPEDYRLVVDWFREREQTRRDDQLDQDSVAPKLDFRFSEGSVSPRKGWSAPGRRQSEFRCHPAFLGLIPRASQ